MAKNTICLWYDKDAEAAARFYAKTFPNSPSVKRKISVTRSRIGTIWLTDPYLRGYTSINSQRGIDRK
jgi:predicted 3-demethylubiquinone-9 3-methyltransferase (glyoxalase superfamily)